MVKKLLHKLQFVNSEPCHDKMCLPAGATSEDTDPHMHPLYVIRTFTLCSINSQGHVNMLTFLRNLTLLFIAQ